MFGDETMLSSDIKKIDNKRRTFLPIFSNAESGDRLILFQEKNYFSLYLKKVFFEKYQILHEKEFDTLDEWMFQKHKIDELCLKISEILVDNQRRILLPKEIVELYQLKDYIYFSGAIDHINGYSTLNHEYNFTKKLNRKK